MKRNQRVPMGWSIVIVLGVVLTQAGFGRVYHLVGDMAGWRREGHAVETGTD